ncbi:helix-turn-helix domain-containing protein [Cerasicoccus fimbriatus]|uniref:helix-turn-helix domain-containing protein n=1 Tax=Cerasicoccus fimbriatus TaxID=3014554 RepID=UPI0022B413FF|nr:AraC family transcriptional regulator [Cerasicoccus sp. TK19100]
MHAKFSTYRFNNQPPDDLPLTVRSCGSYSLTAQSSVEAPRKKWFSELFWSQEGCGEFELDGRWLKVDGTAVFFLLPGETHHIRPISDHWTYHWLTLDHPDSARWLQGFGMSERIVPMSDCPVHLFKSLYKIIDSAALTSDTEAAQMAHEILLTTRDLRRTANLAKSTWLEECRQRIDQDFADSQLNISQLAQDCGVHRTTLFRSFRQHYSMLPSHYLQNRRLHRAMDLLKQTDLPIKAVSHDVGFSDPNYMARLFKKVTGQTPIEFRIAHRQADITSPNHS